MDFIERWFNVSPDGGDGSLELLWLLAATLVVGALLVCWRDSRVARRSVRLPGSSSSSAIETRTADRKVRRAR